MKFGYKFKILRGYTFDSEFIFTEYVDKIYSLKSSVSTGDPIYIISKLLLNSLYGRFGMSPETENHIIISNDNEQFLLDYKILNVLDLNNGNSLLTYNRKETSHNTNLNISIPIASAITAMARVYMSQFKKNPLFELLYTDTDSAFTDKAIDSKIIGTKLGQLKLEHDFLKAVFLAPKVYGGIEKIFNDKLTSAAYIKVKGLKDSKFIDFNSLQKLLIKNNELSISNEKWYRNFSEGNITIKEELYTLIATANKRIPIYENNVFVDTKPYTLKNGVIIDDGL
jgi:hypothetical protein